MVAAALKSGRTRALFRSFYGLSRGQSLVLSGLGHVFRREHFFDRAADYAAEPSGCRSRCGARRRCRRAGMRLGGVGRVRTRPALALTFG